MSSPYKGFAIIAKHIFIAMKKTYKILRKSWMKATIFFASAMCHAGLPLVYIGVISLAILYFTGYTNYNAINFLPIIAILLGIVGYVKGEKRKSIY